MLSKQAKVEYLKVDLCKIMLEQNVGLTSIVLTSQPKPRS